MQEINVYHSFPSSDDLDLNHDTILMDQYHIIILRVEILINLDTILMDRYHIGIIVKRIQEITKWL